MRLPGYIKRAVTVIAMFVIGGTLAFFFQKAVVPGYVDLLFKAYVFFLASSAICVILYAGRLVIIDIVKWIKTGQ